MLFKGWQMTQNLGYITTTTWNAYPYVTRNGCQSKEPSRAG